MASNPKRPFAPEDVYRLRTAGDPRVSPDGKWVAFTLRVVDRAENRYRSNIWAASLDGNNVRRLTSGPSSESQPRWSQAGRLAFLSDRGKEGERDSIAGGGKPQVWLLEMDGSEARQLTYLREGVSGFEWSPDGTRIALVSEVEDAELVGYEERIRKMGIRATRAPGQPEAELPSAAEEAQGADAPTPSEGDSSAQRSSPKPAEGETDSSEYDKSEENKPLVVSRLHYKFDGTGFYDTKRSHIFLADVPIPATDMEDILAAFDLGSKPKKKDEDAGQGAAKKDEKLNPKLKQAQERDPRDTTRQLTSGNWDDGELCWSPDGSLLAFSSSRSPERDYNISINDIFVVETSTATLPPASGEATGSFPVPRQLTRSQGPASAPVFSPDGRVIVYAGHLDPNDHAGCTPVRLYALDPAQEQQEATCLTADFPRSVGAEGVMATNGDHRFSTDGSQLYFFAGDRGNSSIFSVPLAPPTSGEGAVGATSSGSGPEASTNVTRLVNGDNFRMTGFDLLGDGQLVYTMSQTFIPSDLYACALDGTNRRRLTDLNGKLLSELALGTAEKFTVENEGLQIDGWLHKPAGFDAGKQYPLVLQIHGGPQSSFGDGWTLLNHVLVGREYVVVYLNCRGSTSYGEDFARGCLKDWGGGDYRDLMAGVDYACTLPYVDSTRLGVTGYSYGGYMTNWIVGQTTRFKAAVTQASLSNMMSDWGTCDTGALFDDMEFGNPPFDETALYLERSPLMHVRKVETPLLILHGEVDYRCMMEQAEQMYTALKYLRKDVEFVRFPNEPHALFRRGQPRHQVEWLGLMAGWFAEKL